MKRILIIYATIMLMWQTAIADQLVDYKGISLNFPDDWIVFTDENKNQVLDTIEKCTLMFSHNELERYSIFAFSTDEYSVFGKVGVEVTKGLISPDDYSSQEHAIMLKENLKEIGIILLSYDSRIIEIADNNALLHEIEFYKVVENISAKQYQVSIPGHTNTFEIICTAWSENFGQFVPVFNNVINSAKIVDESRLYYHKEPIWLRTLIPILIVMLLCYFIRFVYWKYFKKKSVE